jgi:hypothetical protein
VTWAFFGICLVIGLAGLALSNKISPWFGPAPSDSSADGMAIVPFMIGALFLTSAVVLGLAMIIRAVW